MMDIFNRIKEIKITNGETGNVKKYSKEYLNKLKWIYILKNEEEIDSEELLNDLGIYIFEFDENINLKEKDIQAWYVKANNVVGLYINNSLEDKYEIIKRMIYRIIDEDNIFEYMY